MTPIYLASREPFNYDRPTVYCFKNKIKECNGLKIPLLVPANTIKQYNYSQGFYDDEYVVFPRKIFNIEGEVFLTYNMERVMIDITSKEQYRCLGVEIKSLLKKVWIPIRANFFEQLLIDQEFAEFKRYSIFRDINKDYVVTGKFSVEDGFLVLDA